MNNPYFSFSTFLVEFVHWILPWQKLFRETRNIQKALFWFVLSSIATLCIFKGSSFGWTLDSFNLCSWLAWMFWATWPSTHRQEYHWWNSQFRWKELKEIFSREKKSFKDYIRFWKNIKSYLPDGIKPTRSQKSGSHIGRGSTLELYFLPFKVIQT